MGERRRWSRDELLIALNVYRKLSFGQLHARNPVIVDLAARLDRQPGSIAMKLCNLASLDPALRARGIRGLKGASALDREVWKDFQTRADELVPESEVALRRLFDAGEQDELEVVKATGIRVRRTRPGRAPTGPTESTVVTRARRAQDYFRQVILNAWDRRCCVTGMPVDKLLVASHILPWAAFPNERLNPRNGLCLSSLHDAAFDRGLVTFDEQHRLVIGRDLKAHMPQVAIEHNFSAYSGVPMTPPAETAGPDPDFLRYHREKIFLG